MLTVIDMETPCKRLTVDPITSTKADATNLDSLYQAIAEQELCSNIKAMLERYDLDSMPHLKQAAIEVQAHAMDADERINNAITAYKQDAHISL